MEEYTASATRRIKFAGKFDLGDYYRVLYDMFRSMGYNVMEDRYRIRYLGEADELEIFWNCFKEKDNYVKYRIWAKTLITGLKKTQAQIEGVTVNRHQGECELEVKAFVQTDYLNRWETNPLLTNFKKFYDNYLFRDHLRAHADTVGTDTYRIENEMKAFFNMQQMML